MKGALLVVLSSVFLTLMGIPWPAGAESASLPSPSLNRHAGPTTTTVQSELEGLEKASWVAWKNRDARYFEHFLSEDHVEMGAGGTANKADVVATVASPNCVVASYAVDHFTLTQFSDNTALLTYRAQQDTKCGGKALPSPAWTSSLYVKRGGRWQNALFQQSTAAQ